MWDVRLPAKHVRAVLDVISASDDAEAKEPLQHDTHHQHIAMGRNLSKIASCEEASQNFARRIGIR
jgi:hypothetical protein